MTDWDFSHAAAIRAADRDLIEEEEKLAGPAPPGRPSCRRRRRRCPSASGAAVGLRVGLAGAAAPGAVAVLHLPNPMRALATRSTAVTDAEGKATLFYDPRQWAPYCVSPTPCFGGWGSYAQVAGPRVALPLPELPRAGPLGWWDRAIGIGRHDPERGAGIRI